MPTNKLPLPAPALLPILLTNVRGPVFNPVSPDASKQQRTCVAGICPG